MSRPRPIVSVVTANYNGARYLAAAVRSVLDQSLAELELIIVDDASRDDSLAVIERAAAGDPRVQVLVQDENGGPGAARNRALAAARGHWIAVFDGDDLMCPDRLRVLVERGEADDADIVVDNLMLFSDDSDQPWRPFLFGREYAVPRWIDLGDFIGAGCLYSRRPELGYLKPLVRARALDGVGYREEMRIGEDYNLLLRLLIGRARMRLEPRALYRYRKHGGSTSHTLKPEHVQQMIDGDLGCADDIARQPPRVRRLQRARLRSLHRALIYDRVIRRLKARELAPALTESLANPDVWPLLMRPVEARVKRLAARLPRSAPSGGPAL
ncbi:MAG: glycosyltransferase, partial [Phenylobacterium sp.]|nr:glycosyltransferase [Phenylobacterium sp.]